MRLVQLYHRKGLIWAQNRSETQVACLKWTMHCGAGGPQFESREEAPFLTPSFSRR